MIPTDQPFIPTKRQFDRADAAVDRACERIETIVANLLDRNDGIALDYLVERLLSRLLKRNPQVFDFPAKYTMGSGKATIALTNALLDWRDLWVDR